MTVKVAINGFGRIGRLAFRQMFDSEGYEVVAVTSSATSKMIAHLLKYDSAHGRYEHAEEVSFEEGIITVCGKEIKICTERNPRNLPWEELGIDLVLECTGAFTSKESAYAHIEAGAKKVVISAPAGEDLPTIVFGINEGTLTEDDTVVSAASCTTNCLAPMANALNQLAEIKKGFMSTIHAYTGGQNTLDATHSRGDLRRARSAAVNIIPTTTGAAKAIELVVPELSGKLDGSAHRVPVVDGSLTELVATVKGSVTVEDVNMVMRDAATESFGYTEEELVSSDIIGITYGSLFDATQTRCLNLGGGETLVKVVAWYDNENSYTSQMVRTAKHFVSLK